MKWASPTALLALASLAGCSSGPVTPHTAGMAAPLTMEESSLWRRAEEEQTTIEHSGFVIEAPTFEAYARGVVVRLAATDGSDASIFRVRVLRDPHLNAFAMPNGAIYIHSGLLARLQNEAQLATILAHEMTHVTHRHALRQYRDLKSRTGWLAAATVSAGDFSGVVGLLGGFGTMAAITGYSREMETEADTVGWHRLADSGYATASAPDVFRMLMADIDENARPEPFFLGTHPKLADRERNFRQLNAGRTDESPREDGAERYAAAALPFLLINGEAELRAGRYVAARDQLWRYRTAQPTEVRVRWLLGEIERLAGEEGNLAEARQRYEEALLMDPTFAPAHRSLGLLIFKESPSAAAAEHFRRYLDLEPRAEDRAYIQSYIEQCESLQVSDS